MSYYPQKQMFGVRFERIQLYVENSTKLFQNKFREKEIFMLFSNENQIKLLKQNYQVWGF